MSAQIPRSLKAWASMIEPEESARYYDNLTSIPFSVPWEALPTHKVFKYSLMYTAKARALWNHTSLAGLCDFLALLLEMDPLYTTQHTLEECLEMLLSTRPGQWHQDPYWEAWLRRLPVEYVVATIPSDQWWLYMVHPILNRSFKQFLVYFDYMDDEARENLLKEHPEAKVDLIIFDQLLNRNVDFDFVDSSNTMLKNWIRAAFDRLNEHILRAPYYKNIFVKPTFHEHTLRRNQLMNLSSTCCIMRKFTNPSEAFVEDVLALQAPWLVQQMTHSQVWPQQLQDKNPLQLEYYIMEQTALTLRLAINYYFNEPNLEPFKQQIFIFPRTSTTCYMVGTPKAVRVLRYCQLGNMDMTIPKELDRRTYFHLMDSPPVFPLYLRTWNECIDPRQQHSIVEAIGLRQILLTMIRSCYLAGGKDLANTWYKDVANKSRSLSYSYWEWNEEAMAKSILSVENPIQFILFYQRFFLLLQKGWTSPFAVRKAIVEATQRQPALDDYTASTGSLFNFVESYVFARATHAIHFDTVEWLQSQHIRDFPAGARLINTFALLKEAQNVQTALLKFTSMRETEWRQHWLILDPVIVPRTDMLLECYYLLCHLPQWSEQEVRRLLLSCRLAPSYPLMDDTPASPAISSEMEIDKKNEDDDEDDDDESSSSFSSQSTNTSTTNDWSLDNLDQILAYIQSDAEEEDDDSNSVSMDMSSAAEEDYDSEDNFSCSSVDEESLVPSNVHLNTSVKIRKRKRSSRATSVTANDPSLVRSKVKRRRCNLTFTSNNSNNGGSSAATAKRQGGPNKMQERWNYFNTIIARREIPTVSSLGAAAAYIQPAPQLILPWQIEFFAALEDVVHGRHVTNDNAVLTRIVELNQNFLSTFGTNNNYTVYFGRDNIQKLIHVKSHWFDSQNYMQVVWSKIAQIKSHRFHQFAQNTLTKFNCRYYFDNEVLCIPAVIDRIVSRYGMHTHQRQFLEWTFEALPRILAPPQATALHSLQEQLQQRLLVDRVLMPPPTSMTSSGGGEDGNKRPKPVKFHNYTPPPRL